MKEVSALLVTGATYPNRREIRALGGVWQADECGYAVPLDKLTAIEAISGLVARNYEFECDPFKPLTDDELRAYRQDKQERRRERLLDRADLADIRADKARNRISKHEREFLSLCEPVKIGHHSQRRHQKLIKRAQDSFMKEGEERSYANDLRSRADFVRPALVAGDTERKREAVRQAKAAQIGVGDTVNSALYGIGIVTKCNKKTFTVNFASRGFVMTIDKSWTTLVAKGEAKAAQIVRKFKNGDKVIASEGFAKYSGTIKRATSRGYSVEMTYRYGNVMRTDRRTFAECSIEIDNS